mmetsp:Transcript_124855/g.266430  ORF Transcript_124855/g.266430 Transcript_124855/m.266430 type:complete len:232 (+) Transcript_124855:82-777(+)
MCLLSQAIALLMHRRTPIPGLPLDLVVSALLFLEHLPDVVLVLLVRTGREPRLGAQGLQHMRLLARLAPTMLPLVELAPALAEALLLLTLCSTVSLQLSATRLKLLTADCELLHLVVVLGLTRRQALLEVQQLLLSVQELLLTTPESCKRFCLTGRELALPGRELLLPLSEPPLAGRQLLLLAAPTALLGGAELRLALLCLQRGALRRNLLLYLGVAGGPELLSAQHGFAL